MKLAEKLEEAAGFVRSRLGERRPTVGLVLGSGLGSFADTLTDAEKILYRDIPHFPVSSVSGHAGQLVLGHSGQVTCAAMQGRVHHYEGHSAETVAFPVRTLIALGARTVIITNAAGGLRHQAGTLMLIRDHLNLIGENPLRGPNESSFGPRFPDMTEAYDPALRAIASEVASGIGIELAEGVYAAMPGPSYETPAEIRMLDVLGADAVGMSTVPEVIAARHMGARVLGISCISNPAAGIAGEPLSHAEVEETARAVRPKFEQLLQGILTRLGEEKLS